MVRDVVETDGARAVLLKAMEMPKVTRRRLWVRPLIRSLQGEQKRNLYYSQVHLMWSHQFEEK